MNDIKIIKNWRFYGAKEPYGELHISKGQFMTGNIAGILITDEAPKYHLNSICNAKSFAFPVRYKIIDLSKKDSIIENIKNSVRELELEGCRYIVTSGSRFIEYAELIKNSTNLLTLCTPLQLISLLSISTNSDKKIVIITDNSVESIQSLLPVFINDNKIISRCEVIEYCAAYSEDPDNIPFNLSEIGGIIWDSINSDFKLRQTHECPVYSMTVIVNFLMNVCAQRPYEGLV